jgi:hypothetical protein
VLQVFSPGTLVRLRSYKVDSNEQWVWVEIADSDLSGYLRIKHGTLGLFYFGVPTSGHKYVEEVRQAEHPENNERCFLKNRDVYFDSLLLSPYFSEDAVALLTKLKEMGVCDKKKNGRCGFADNFIHLDREIFQSETHVEERFKVLVALTEAGMCTPGKASRCSIKGDHITMDGEKAFRLNADSKISDLKELVQAGACEKGAFPNCKFKDGSVVIKNTVGPSVSVADYLKLADTGFCD